jgi:hypothetical protein
MSRKKFRKILDKLIPKIRCPFGSFWHWLTLPRNDKKTPHRESPRVTAAASRGVLKPDFRIKPALVRVQASFHDRFFLPSQDLFFQPLNKVINQKTQNGYNHHRHKQPGDLKVDLGV